MPIEYIVADCLEYLPTLATESIDVVITSPPYFIPHLTYNKFKISGTRQDYLDWCNTWLVEVKRILKPQGALFLNVGSTCRDPWISTDVAYVARNHLVLQNKILWVKAVSLENKSHGHFKPITSNRFLNHLYEDLYHFTKDGNLVLDKLAIGVPFEEKYNLERWNNDKDLRCRGDVWYIPYETIRGREKVKNHPAIFPEKLVEWCLKVHGLPNIKNVLDPFSGIGTTGKVCKKFNLDFIGIDLDSDYVDFARKNNG